MLIFVKTTFAYASNFFLFETYIIADDKNDNKTILISFVKKIEQMIDVPKLSRFVYH